MASGFCLVEAVRQRLRRNAPCSPASRINRSTRLRETRTPRRRSVACTRGEP
jgi:hypothetical protein